MRHALLIFASILAHKESNYELQCLHLLTNSRHKKNYFELYLRIRAKIMSFADQKIVRPVTLMSTNLSYSPSKALSSSSSMMGDFREDLGMLVFLRDIFLTREEYKDTAAAIKESFPQKL